MRYVWGAAAAFAVMLAAACGSNDATSPAAATRDTAATATATPAAGTRDMTVTAGTTVARLNVELAATEAEREHGLMGRTALSDDAGMLFIFPGDSTVGFWMKDTLVALDIAYLDADGVVLGIVHGRPLDETVLPPPSPYRYALEVAGGWFARKGLGVGAAVSIPADLPPGE